MLYGMSVLDVEDWADHLGTDTPTEAIAVLTRWETAVLAVQDAYRSIARGAEFVGREDVAVELGDAVRDLGVTADRLADARRAFCSMEVRDV